MQSCKFVLYFSFLKSRLILARIVKVTKMTFIGNSTTKMFRRTLREQTLLSKPRQEVIQNALHELTEDRVRSVSDRHLYKMQVK